MLPGGAPVTVGRGRSRWVPSPKTSMMGRRPPPFRRPFRQRVKFSSRSKAKTPGATTGLTTPSHRPSTRPTETPMKTGSWTPRTTARTWWVPPPTTAKAARTRTAMDGPIRTVDGVFRMAQTPLQANPHNGWTPTMTGTETTSMATKATTANSVVATPPPIVMVAWTPTAIRTPTLTLAA